MKNVNLPEVYLVSCVKVKKTNSVSAKDLYQSIWFKAARAFVEDTKKPWFILSARYGLLDPETIVAPYDRTLLKMSVAERRQWAQETVAQIADRLPPCRLIYLAGIKYREFLIPLLAGRGYAADTPLARFGIGCQVQWLQRQLIGK